MYGGTHLQGDRRICTMCKQDFDSIYVARPWTAKKHDIAWRHSMAKGQRPYPEVSSTFWECPQPAPNTWNKDRKDFEHENISRLLCLHHLFHIQPVRLQPCAGVKCIVAILACLLRVSAIRSWHNGQLWRACGRGTLKSMPSLHRKQCSMPGTLLPLSCLSSLANFSSIFTSLLHAAACTCKDQSVWRPSYCNGQLIGGKAWNGWNFHNGLARDEFVSVQFHAAVSVHEPSSRPWVLHKDPVPTESSILLDWLSPVQFNPATSNPANTLSQAFLASSSPCKMDLDSINCDPQCSCKPHPFIFVQSCSIYLCSMPSTFASGTGTWLPVVKRIDHFFCLDSECLNNFCLGILDCKLFGSNLITPRSCCWCHVHAMYKQVQIRKLSLWTVLCAAFAIATWKSSLSREKGCQSH